MEVVSKYTIEDIKKEFNSVYKLDNCRSIEDILNLTAEDSFAKEKISRQKGVFLLSITSLNFIVFKYDEVYLCLKVVNNTNFYNLGLSVSFYNGDYKTIIKKVVSQSLSKLDTDDMYLLLSFYASCLEDDDSTLPELFRVIRRLWYLEDKKLSKAVVFFLLENLDCIADLKNACEILASVVQNKSMNVSSLYKLVGGVI